VPEEAGATDRRALERAIGDVIRALRLDSRAEPELEGTPARVADFLLEAFSGLAAGAAPELETFPCAGGEDVVVVRDLEFHSMCIHHFAPFFGRALIAYRPADTLLGVSGAARLLDHYARRPQLQERMTREIADHLERLVRPRGVAVVLEARHLCMEMRGVRRRALVETRVVRGELADPRHAGLLRFAPGPGAGERADRG
jgi:GTP cyclohydrolase I